MDGELACVICTSAMFHFYFSDLEAEISHQVVFVVATARLSTSLNNVDTDAELLYGLLCRDVNRQTLWSKNKC